MKYSIREMDKALRDDFSDPLSASGMCYIASEDILNEFSDLHILVADHSNNPMRRYKKLGQYSNHYAPYDPVEDKVYDFTMRQFNPDCGYPFIGTKVEWLTELANAWETDSVRFIEDYWFLDAEKIDFDSPEEYQTFRNSIQFWNHKAVAA